MDIKKAVCKEQRIGQIFDENETINIAFGVDKLYVPMMGILMTSIVKNNNDVNFAFHIFFDSMNDSDFDKLNQFAKDFSNAQVNLYLVSADLFKDFYIDRSYSTAIFYRIIAAEYLSCKMDKLIYMDSDMICLKSMHELFSTEFDGAFLMAVKDPGSCIDSHKIDKLHLDSDYIYFNTGILYINLKLWIEYNAAQQLMDILSQDDYLFPDQDALNIFVNRNHYKVKYISNKFNNFFRVEGITHELDFDENTIIEHFSGQLKPWHPWCDGSVKQIYNHYQSISLWSDFVYKPKNYQENRIMGKYCRRNGKWLEALRWYYLYLKQHGKK